MFILLYTHRTNLKRHSQGSLQIHSVMSTLFAGTLRVQLYSIGNIFSQIWEPKMLHRGLHKLNLLFG